MPTYLVEGGFYICLWIVILKFILNFFDIYLWVVISQLILNFIIFFSNEAHVTVSVKRKNDAILKQNMYVREHAEES